MKKLQFSLKDCLVFIFAISCALGGIRWFCVKAHIYEFFKTNPWPSPYAYAILIFCAGAFIFMGIWFPYFYGYRKESACICTKKCDCQNPPLSH